MFRLQHNTFINSIIKEQKTCASKAWVTRRQTLEKKQYLVNVKCAAVWLRHQGPVVTRSHVLHRLLFFWRTIKGNSCLFEFSVTNCRCSAVTLICICRCILQFNSVVFLAVILYNLPFSLLAMEWTDEIVNFIEEYREPSHPDYKLSEVNRW